MSQRSSVLEPTPKEHQQRKQVLSATDEQRKKLCVNPTFYRYSNVSTSPLGTDHKAVVLHRVAQEQANLAGSAMLSRSITLSDTYKRARELQKQGDFVAAAAELGQAKLLSHDEQRLEKAYQTAAAVHLAAMMHLLTTALAESAKREALKELAQSPFAAFVAETANTEATQAPAERQSFTAPPEAPPLASADAGAAPPCCSAQNTDLASSLFTETDTLGVM